MEFAFLAVSPGMMRSTCEPLIWVLVRQGFSAFSVRRSQSPCLEEGRGRPDEGWWAAKPGLLGETTHLKKEGTGEGCGWSFKSRGFYEIVGGLMNPRACHPVRFCPRAHLRIR